MLYACIIAWEIFGRGNVPLQSFSFFWGGGGSFLIEKIIWAKPAPAPLPNNINWLQPKENHQKKVQGRGVVYFTGKVIT